MVCVLALQKLRSPLTEYFFWPRKDAWEELKSALEAKPWVSERSAADLLSTTACPPADESHQGLQHEAAFVLETLHTSMLATLQTWLGLGRQGAAGELPSVVGWKKASACPDT